MKKSYLTYINAMIASLLLGYGSVQAETLQENSTYIIKILPGGDSAEVGQCSAFTFGDISTVCGFPVGPLVDNTVLGAPSLTGGDGIAGDGLAGTLNIETGTADASGLLEFAVTAFQMDPYLETPGGTFKTTMTPPDGALMGAGRVDAAGNMTLDLTGRTGVAEYFEFDLGIQPWNINDSLYVQNNGDPVTNEWEPFTTGSSTNYDPFFGGPNLTLIGRPIGDANSDGILDAVLVSVGNLGQVWLAFDGVPYSEGLNVQFELVSSVVPISIDIKPYSDPNSINLSSSGLIPVAILSSEDLDATTVNPEAVSLAGSGVAQVSKGKKHLCNPEDVNLDGLLDLVCHVYSAQFVVEEGKTTAVLEAETYDGTPLRGEDSIHIVPDDL